MTTVVEAFLRAYVTCERPGANSFHSPTAVGLLQQVLYVKNKTSKRVSCEFDDFGNDTHICKLRDAPAARLSYGGCQGEH